MQSSAEKAETAAPGRDRLLSTFAFMADRRFIAAAWLDDALRPVATYGRLADDLPAGVPVTRSVAALMGFDEEIAALRGSDDAQVTVPDVRIPGSAHADERLSYAVRWMPGEDCYLLLIACAFSRFDLEYRLAAESRARSIAEAEVAAQARLIERANRELATANRDLAEFASVISHDLRAPLRGLRYAAEDARAALGHGEHEQAAAEIDKTLSQARRMSRMLTSLLAYARAGRKIDEIETVDTGALATDIAHSIGAASTQTIAVEGHWPTFPTLAEPLDIVLRNLIDNAVKHHDRDDGRIVVSAEDTAEALLVSVADDGPGIERTWHEAIFLPFKRIGDNDGAAGSGIGLALVKKTVERFGGSIRLESDPARSRGATFRVAWPKTLP